jgi:hypothetical protein
MRVVSNTTGVQLVGTKIPRVNDAVLAVSDIICLWKVIKKITHY